MTAEAAKLPVILVFGDSLSAGYGIKIEQSWPNLLQQRLGKTYQVINASQSGETTAGGLTRLPDILKRYQPNIVILQLGANDGLLGLPLQQAQHNLNTMIQLSKTKKAKVLLVAMQLPPNWGEQYTHDFRHMYEQLAQRHRLIAPPFLLANVAQHPELFQADQLHPTAQAQPKLLDNIWKPLQKLLTHRQKSRYHRKSSSH